MILFFEKDVTKYPSMIDDKRLTSTIYYVTIALSDALHDVGGLGPFMRSDITDTTTLDWLKKSRDNYLWMLDLLESMLYEFQERFEEKHQASGYTSWFRENSVKIINGARTSFPNPPKLNGVEIEGIFSDPTAEHMAVLSEVVSSELAPSSWWRYPID